MPKNRKINSYIIDESKMEIQFFDDTHETILYCKLENEVMGTEQMDICVQENIEDIVDSWITNVTHHYLMLKDNIHIFSIVITTDSGEYVIQFSNQHDGTLRHEFHFYYLDNVENGFI